jgi:hypothetical protein
VRLGQAAHKINDEIVMTANAPVVHIGENSPENVALRLVEIIASIENKQLRGHLAHPADRQWLLDTYSECLQAVQERRSIRLDN